MTPLNLPAPHEAALPAQWTHYAACLAIAAEWGKDHEVTKNAVRSYRRTYIVNDATNV